MKVYSWEDVEALSKHMVELLEETNWAPDYIVGIVGGSCIPAALISKYADIPMETLKVELPDAIESNCWMAEDAFGYSDYSYKEEHKKNILIMFDVFDKEIVECIKDDWGYSVANADHTVWNRNVKFASLICSPSDVLDVDYASLIINPIEANESHYSFPWKQFTI